jgi:serine/threonine-protein kinase
VDNTTPQEFGAYVIYGQIGHGGMATVHVAEKRNQTGERRRVAIKRLLPRAAARPELVAAFIHEARLMRHLHHPNIAETYDFGKVGETYFIAMEYVPGPTLKQLVNHCGKTVGTVPTQITLNLASQLCEALDHAHNRCDNHGKPLGIIHRDVSPSNIILSETGLVRLIDFGLAKAKGTPGEETGEGMIKGKYGYVAPEYIGGELDSRADLWAVGVVMYELLTSRRLFDAPDNFETMTRVRKLPIPHPSRANPLVPPDLDDIVMTALERDPARRWQSAAALRTALRAVIAKPNNFVDNHHVIDWVHWVFTQKPGTEFSGISKLAEMLEPEKPAVLGGPLIAPPPDPEESLRPGGRIWIVVALIVIALAAVAIAVLASK